MKKIINVAFIIAVSFFVTNTSSASFSSLTSNYLIYPNVTNYSSWDFAPGFVTIMVPLSWNSSDFSNYASSLGTGVQLSWDDPNLKYPLIPYYVTAYVVDNELNGGYWSNTLFGNPAGPVDPNMVGIGTKIRFHASYDEYFSSKYTVASNLYFYGPDDFSFYLSNLYLVKDTPSLSIDAPIGLNCSQVNDGTGDIICSVTSDMEAKNITINLTINSGVYLGLNGYKIYATHPAAKLSYTLNILHKFEPKISHLYKNGSDFDYVVTQDSIWTSSGFSVYPPNTSPIFYLNLDNPLGNDRINSGSVSLGKADSLWSVGGVNESGKSFSLSLGLSPGAHKICVINSVPAIPTTTYDYEYKIPQNLTTPSQPSCLDINIFANPNPILNSKAICDSTTGKGTISWNYSSTSLTVKGYHVYSAKTPKTPVATLGSAITSYSGLSNGSYYVYSFDSTNNDYTSYSLQGNTTVSCKITTCSNGATNYPTCTFPKSTIKLSGPTVGTTSLPYIYTDLGTTSDKSNIHYYIGFNQTFFSTTTSIDLGTTTSGVGKSVSVVWPAPGSYKVCAASSPVTYPINISSTSCLTTIINSATTTCSNGATNPPTCTTCSSTQTMVNGTCVNNCTNGATNPPSCNNNTCSNGTTDYPTCTTCSSGKTLVNNSCVANCTNGATNPTSCTTCPSTQTMVNGNCINICSNGATNYPTCDKCDSSQILVNNTCTALINCDGNTPSGYIITNPITTNSTTWKYVSNKKGNINNSSLLKPCEWTCLPNTSTSTYYRSGDECDKISITEQ